MSDIQPAEFDMPTEEVTEGADVHVPAGWLEEWEAKERKAGQKDPLARAMVSFGAEAGLGMAGVFSKGTTPIVTRAAWGARNPRGAYTSISATGGVGFHWEGPRMGSFSHDSCASKVRGIQAYHMDHNRWLDIAYSGLVCPHGYIFVGRWLHNRTAANGTNDANDRFYALCGLFGDGDPFTDEAMAAYLDGVQVLRSQGGAGNGVRPHSSFKATACPGDDVRAWINNGLPAPAGYLDSPPPSPPTTLPSRAVGVIGFIEDPTSDGGWMVTTEGHIFTLAPSGFYGSLGGVPLRAPITGGVATPSGRGYWLFGADGGVFAFGDAPFRGTYGALADEFARGERAIIGGTFRGNHFDPESWRYSLISDRLESYAI